MLTSQATARTAIRDLIAQPGACTCPTLVNRRGLHVCRCCGFHGHLADHLTFSARIAAGDTTTTARRTAAAARHTTQAWLDASGWSPVVGIECDEHGDLPEAGQLHLLGACGRTWDENIPAAPTPPRTFTYYLGARPSWLGDPAFADVPLMVAAPTLDRYRGSGWTKPAGAAPTVPDVARRWGRWFGDSGAFMALTGSGTNRGDVHPWHLGEEEYAAFWVRVCDDFGWPDFVAPQDMPCEPVVLARTGQTVREHIEQTVENFLRLRELAPSVPWIPVLQGWEPADYLYAADLYEASGVDLTAEPLVGVGSICRRGSVPGIVRVLGTLAGRGYRLHGFGVKIEALPLIGHLLASADSYAWSDTARKEGLLLPGCRHVTRECARDHGPDCDEHLTDCRNCGRWAREWRRRVLDRAPRYTLGLAG